MSLAQHTPIIIASGQSLQALAATDDAGSLKSPMDLAADACRAALQDAALDSALGVDTIAVVRLFADSSPLLQSPFGGSNNPPESVASRIGARPRSRIYSEVGGSVPQQLLVEMCFDLARGDREMVLLCGAEAIGNQKLALRAGLQPDWRESFSESLQYEDRGYGKAFMHEREMANALFLPLHYYSLIENARAHRAGQDKQAQREAMARLFAHFSQIAAGNPFAQFPTAYSCQELADISADNYLLSDPYTRHLVAKDGVNQGAALLLTTVARARELGIPQDHWIHLHGYAQGYDHFTSLRPELGKSAAMEGVFQRCLQMAERGIDDIELVDIYSCFPCAVASACEALSLPQDGSRCLTLTGGLPFFGGPGNNYSMHALAEMAQQLRDKAESYAFISANGGILSKHAAGVYSRQPGRIDWLRADNPLLEAASLPGREFAEQPDKGRIVSYTLVYQREKATQCIIVADTDDASRLLATSIDPAVLAAVAANSPIGRPIRVVQHGQQDNPHSNIFTFCD